MNRKNKPERYLKPSQTCVAPSVASLYELTERSTRGSRGETAQQLPTRTCSFFFFLILWYFVYFSTFTSFIFVHFVMTAYLNLFWFWFFLFFLRFFVVKSWCSATVALLSSSASFFPVGDKGGIKPIPVHPGRRWSGFGLRCIAEAGRRGSPGGWTPFSSSCLFFPSYIFLSFK